MASKFNCHTISFYSNLTWVYWQLWHQNALYKYWNMLNFHIRAPLCFVHERRSNLKNFFESDHIVHEDNISRLHIVKCGMCNRCSYIVEGDGMLFLQKYGLALPHGQHNCSTKVIIYLPICQMCNNFYVGKNGKCFRTWIHQIFTVLRKITWAPLVNMHWTALALKGQIYGAGKGPFLFEGWELASQIEI